MDRIRYLNGVVLVSPTEIGIKREGPVADALTLPYYCATAWYIPSTNKFIDLHNFTRLY